MKKPLVIISACQFTRLALESLIPTDRYIVRVYSNVTTEVEFVLKTSCGYLLADILRFLRGSWFFWLVSPVCGVMPGNGRSA